MRVRTLRSGAQRANEIAVLLPSNVTTNSLSLSLCVFPPVSAQTCLRRWMGTKDGPRPDGPATHSR